MQRKTHFHKYPISSNSQKEDGLKLWAEFTKYVRIHTTNRVTSCFCCHIIFPDSPLILSLSIVLSQTVHFREVLCRLINYYAMGVVWPTAGFFHRRRITYSVIVLMWGLLSKFVSSDAYENSRSLLSWCLLCVILIYASIPCSCKFMLHGDNGSVLKKTILAVNVILTNYFVSVWVFEVQYVFPSCNIYCLSDEYSGLVIRNYWSVRPFDPPFSSDVWSIRKA